MKALNGDKIMSIKERINQYNYGLISADELEQYLQAENNGADSVYYGVTYTVMGKATLLINGKPNFEV